MALAPAYAIAILMTAGPDDGCPSPHQLADALSAHLPGMVLPLGHATGPTTLRLGVATDAAGAMRLDLSDPEGGPLLHRWLPATDRAHAGDCPALAETAALIVERYWHEVGYDVPLETPNASPKPPPPKATAPPPPPPPKVVPPPPPPKVAPPPPKPAPPPPPPTVDKAAARTTGARAAVGRRAVAAASLVDRRQRRGAPDHLGRSRGRGDSRHRGRTTRLQTTPRPPPVGGGRDDACLSPVCDRHRRLLGLRPLQRRCAAVPGSDGCLPPHLARCRAARARNRRRPRRRRGQLQARIDLRDAPRRHPRNRRRPRLGPAAAPQYLYSGVGAGRDGGSLPRRNCL